MLVFEQRGGKMVFSFFLFKKREVDNSFFGGNVSRQVILDTSMHLVSGYNRNC